MFKKSLILLAVVVATMGLCLAQEKTSPKPEVKKAPIKQTNAASGKEMFTQYCAPCHGTDGQGKGPAASAMKSQPTDLTQLKAKNNGKYPDAHIAQVIKQGGPGAHGSAEMPVWGPLFQSLDKYHDSVVQQRVSNLVNYIETLQGN